MNNKLKRISVCHCGSALISTLAFHGAEYWCADCGNTYGMFDCRRVDSTPELEFDLIINKARTKKFLDARGTLSCDSMLIKGKWVDRKDLPVHIIERAKKVVKEFMDNRSCDQHG